VIRLTSVHRPLARAGYQATCDATIIAGSLDLRYEQCSPPHEASLVDAAKQQPNGWVYDIDWAYPETQRTPPEAIRGSWKVDGDGQLTGLFAVNPRYRPVERCERKLKPYVHAAARTNRSQWIVEIDPRGEDQFPNISEEMIRGWWYVDDQGVVTDQFRPNSRWAGETDAAADPN
jgi:hypothetical protein